MFLSMFTKQTCVTVDWRGGVFMNVHETSFNT